MSTLSRKKKETLDERKERETKEKKLDESYDKKLNILTKPIRKKIRPALSLYKTTLVSDIKDVKYITLETIGFGKYIGRKFRNLYNIFFIHGNKLTGKIKGYKAYYCDSNFLKIFKRLEMLENILEKEARFLPLDLDDIHEFVRTKMVDDSSIMNILDEAYTLYRYAMVIDKIDCDDDMQIINEDIRESIQIHNVGYLDVPEEITNKLDELCVPNLVDGINYWYEYQISHVMLSPENMLDLTSESCISRESLYMWLNKKEQEYEANIVRKINIMKSRKKRKSFKLHKKHPKKHYKKIYKKLHKNHVNKL